MKDSVGIERSQIADAASAIRVLTADAIEKAQSGHPGMPLGMAEIGATIFANHLKFDPADPEWADRDRFVVSNGHGSMLLYSLLHLAGYEAFGMDTLKNFRQLHSPAAGHPEIEFPGVEATTGPLGQGVAMAVGMAIAERTLRARHSAQLTDHYTYVLAGDGCLMEGVGQEAISLAGHLQLDRLIMLFDDNEISIDGPTSLSVSENHTQRFEAAGWEVLSIDGHDIDAIDAAIVTAKASDKPVLIRCKTLIGRGVPGAEGNSKLHSGAMGPDLIKLLRDTIGWQHPPFTIPDETYEAFATAREKGQTAHALWSKTLAALGPKEKAAWDAQFAPDAAPVDQALDTLRAELVKERPNEATRQSSARAIEAIADLMPNLIAGSADLTPACLTKADNAQPILGPDHGGSYLYYGVREHAMAAVMNGLVMHGGFLPVGSTFLCFTDYARPAIRLAALMGLHSVMILSHDSITQGEDGPTHQAVEHAAILRATPNLYFMRPADAVETVECWQAALKVKNAPVLMACTRPAVPTVRQDGDSNKSAKGAYVIHGDAAERDVTILATGTEVSLAIKAADHLASQGTKATVVSMPCWELFEEQGEDYKASILGTAPRIAVEVMSPFGWTRYVDREEDVLGMTTFGASAPMAALLEHFGFTVEGIAALAQRRIARFA